MSAPGQCFGILATVDNPAAIVLWLEVLWLKYKELIPHEDLPNPEHFRLRCSVYLG